MPTGSASPRFFARSDQDLTLKHSEGRKNHAILAAVGHEATRDDGARRSVA